MTDHKTLLQKCEQNYETMLLDRVENKNSFWYGLMTPEKSHYRWSFFVTMLVLYKDEASMYFRNSTVLKHMKEYSEGLLREQMPSGFISLFDCNIDSPPDTAFSVMDIAPCYMLIQKCNFTELGEIQNNLELYLKKAAAGLCTGGIHTPNHRWVISAALTLCYEIFKEERYKTRIFDFLHEGLDVNSYGEWTEKSNAIYNSVCDLYLYHIARVFNLDYVFEAITRNLKMMQYLLHPDFSIVTEYSTRQDRAKRMPLTDKYAIIFELMAAHDEDGEFAYLAEKALETTESFAYLILYRTLFEPKSVASVPISDNYHILLNENEKEQGGFGSCVLRHRKGDLSLTIMEDQKDFMFLQYGNARMIGMRLVFGWFGVAAVAFDSLTKTSENQYKLETVLTGSYMDAFPREMTEGKKGKFEKFEYDGRLKTSVLKLKLTIEIEIIENQIDIVFKCDDMPHLCAQVVCLFDKDGTLSGDTLEKVDAYNSFLPQGNVTYQNGTDVIHIDGGCKEHKLVNIRNYVTDINANNILINYLSPYQKKISIKCYKG